MIHVPVRPLLVSVCLLALVACTAKQEPAPQANETGAASAAAPLPEDRQDAAPDASLTRSQSAVAQPLPDSRAEEEPGQALSQTGGDTLAQIDTVLGNGVQYHLVFLALKQAVGRGNVAATAALMRYPLRVSIDGKERTVADAAEFIRDHDSIITPEIAKVIAAQAFDVGMVSQRGLKFGDGQVWISGTCYDNDCTQQDIKVTAIQSVP